MSYPYKMDANNVTFWKVEDNVELRESIWRAYNDLFFTSSRIDKVADSPQIPDEVAEQLRAIARTVRGLPCELSLALPGAIEAEVGTV